MIQTGSILRALWGAETTVHGVEKQTISRKKIKEFESKSYDSIFGFLQQRVGKEMDGKVRGIPRKEAQIPEWTNCSPGETVCPAECWIWGTKWHKELPYSELGKSHPGVCGETPTGRNTREEATSVEHWRMRVKGKSNSKMPSSWANHRCSKISMCSNKGKLEHVCWSRDLKYETKEAQAGTRLQKAEQRHPTFIQDTEDHQRSLGREQCGHSIAPRLLTCSPAQGGGALHQHRQSHSPGVRWCGLSWGSDTGQEGTPQEKENYHMTQQCHSWAYTLRKTSFKKTHAP